MSKARNDTDGFRPNTKYEGGNKGLPQKPILFPDVTHIARRDHSLCNKAESAIP